MEQKVKQKIGINRFKIRRLSLAAVAALIVPSALMLLAIYCSPHKDRQQKFTGGDSEHQLTGGDIGQPQKSRD